MRTYQLAGSALLLALPLTLAACPSEPTNGLVTPPQPSAPATVAPSSSAEAAVPARPAFENPGGMWMPEQMPLHEATLKSLGLQIPPASLAQLDGAPMGAIVSLGGCTGSFVSPDGLIVTNHHCVTGYLGFASSKEKDYVTDGVHAKDRAGEVFAGPSGRVLITRSIKDVTAEVRAGIDKVKDDLARLREVEKHTKALVAACEKDRPEVRCNVVSFFGGSQYRLIEQLELKDLRMVFVPPKGIGNYGGEIDNWQWPRHSGDFAFLRIYVGKDGKPAEHAASNVPYRPAQHLSMATSPLRAGDLVIVAGYPAITSRMKVASQVEDAVGWAFPKRIESYSAFMPLVDSFGDRSPEVKIKTSIFTRGLSNALIKSKGIVEGFAKGNRIEERKKAEAELLAFIDADPARKTAWGGTVEAMNARLAELRKTREHDAALREMLFMPRLLGQAMLIVRAAEERAKPDAERDPDYQERNYQIFKDRTATFQKYYDREIEKAVLGLAMERTSKLDAASWPKLPAGFLGKVTKEDREKKIASMYDRTKLEDVELRQKLLTTAKIADLKKLKDPLLDFALAMRPVQKVVDDRDEALGGALLLLAPKYAEALRAFAKSQGKPDVAPDANSTLRLTYGTVRGYRPAPDAPVYTPFTTLAELVKKHTGKEPFNVPQASLDAFQAGKKGPYLFQDIGDVPVDFLSDLDITGGNSGSPTLNAKGELVGLAFDGNYEGVASDWLFLPELTRTIHVDARYILWVLDAVSGAKEILAELKQTPAFAK